MAQGVKNHFHPQTYLTLKCMNLGQRILKQTLLLTIDHISGCLLDAANPELQPFLGMSHCWLYLSLEGIVFFGF